MLAGNLKNSSLCCWLTFFSLFRLDYEHFVQYWKPLKSITNSEFAKIKEAYNVNLDYQDQDHVNLDDQDLQHSLFRMEQLD